MKLKFWIIVVLAGILPCGCGHPPNTAGQNPTPQNSPVVASTGSQAPPHAYAQGSIKKGDLAICVVCAVNEGSTEKEPAHEVIDYEGKTYSFCNEEEKAQFISSPAKYAAK